MKTALSIYNGRLAPVFDVSRHLLLLEWQEGRVVSRTEIRAEEPALPMLAELKRMGIDQLICGAISGPMQHAALAMGLEVIGFLTGDLEQVIEALIHGRLQQIDLSMPGCRGMGGGGMGRRCGGRGLGRGRRFQSGYNRYKEKDK